MRIVMGVNTWPEEDQFDFEVTRVLEHETDEDAIARASKAYSPEQQFYIIEKQ